MAAADRHTGPWMDTGRDAVTAALDEVRVSEGEYIWCTFSDPYYVLLEPVDPERLAIACEIAYSESRDQFKAKLQRVPAHVD